MDEGKAAQLGIIPAYAGSTRSGRRDAIRSRGSSPHTRGARILRTLSVVRSGDHPRIRGEHIVDGELKTYDFGIIPAYAGSTFRLNFKI